ncbi:MAG TPA: transporter substrate-binding domain-containing protein, partial [Spirochaetales bacterium]|nr:transporter substrate-binding domain-containing protein [Spirochaetales bacterium]
MAIQIKPLAALLFVLAAPIALAQGKPSSITVVCDNNYPPYAFQTQDGRLQGIVPDLWEAWEAATGVSVRLVGMDWHNALEAIEQGKADVIDTIVKSEEREGWLDFTPAYTSFDVPIFFHRDIASISNFFDLRGYRVAAKSGDHCMDILRANGVKDIREYPSYETIVNAALHGDERVFCMDEPPVLYLLFKHDAVSEFKRSIVVYEASFYRAVRNGDRDMLALVNDGFKAVGPKVL